MSRPLVKANRLFRFKTFFNYPELLPVAMLPTVTVVMGVAYIMYGLCTKPDVIIAKKKELPPWERVDPEKTTKLMRIGQEYKVNDNLEGLKKEIGDK